MIDCLMINDREVMCRLKWRRMDAMDELNRTEFPCRDSERKSGPWRGLRLRLVLASDSVIHSGPNLPQSVGGGVLRNRENRHHCRTSTVAYSSQNIPFSVYAVASIPH